MTLGIITIVAIIAMAALYLAIRAEPTYKKLEKEHDKDIADMNEHLKTAFGPVASREIDWNGFEPIDVELIEHEDTEKYPAGYIQKLIKEAPQNVFNFSTTTKNNEPKKDK